MHVQDCTVSKVTAMAMLDNACAVLVFSLSIVLVSLAPISD